MMISTLREIARRKIIKWGTPLTVARCMRFKLKSGRKFRFAVLRTVWFAVSQIDENRLQLTCPWNAKLVAGRDRVYYYGAAYEVKSVMGLLDEGLVVTVVCDAVLKVGGE